MSTSTDLQDVRALPARIVAAWAKNDAEEFAHVFTEDGTLVLPGGVFETGREAICAFMKAGFAGPYRGTNVYGLPVSARFLTPESAVLITEGGVLAPGETEVADERKIRAIWVLVKRDGEWQLAAYQNTPIAG